jgi:hypothetical protein
MQELEIRVRKVLLPAIPREQQTILNVADMSRGTGFEARIQVLQELALLPEHRRHGIVIHRISRVPLAALITLEGVQIIGSLNQSREQLSTSTGSLVIYPGPVPENQAVAAFASQTIHALYHITPALLPADQLQALMLNHWSESS